MVSIMEIADRVGKQAAYNINGINVDIKIIDIRQVYGNTRYLITPLAGTGQIWVNEESLVIYK